jgi:hypothetical protein
MLRTADKTLFISGVRLATVTEGPSGAAGAPPDGTAPGHRADYGCCRRVVNGLRTDHASPAERAARPAIARTTIGRTSGEAAPGLAHG